MKKQQNPLYKDEEYREIMDTYKSFLEVIPNFPTHESIKLVKALQKKIIELFLDFCLRRKIDDTLFIKNSIAEIGIRKSRKFGQIITAYKKAQQKLIV